MIPSLGFFPSTSNESITGSHLPWLFTKHHLAHALDLLSQDMFPVFLVCCANMTCTLTDPSCLELYSSIFQGFRRASPIHFYFLHLTMSSTLLWRVVHFNVLIVKTLLKTSCFIELYFNNNNNNKNIHMKMC